MSSYTRSVIFNIGGFIVVSLSCFHLHHKVSYTDVLPVARLVKMVMENSCRLSVATPVKVKVGASWGSLRELKIE